MHSTTPERLEMCRKAHEKGLAWPDLVTEGDEYIRRVKEAISAIHGNDWGAMNEPLGWKPPFGSTFGLGLYDQIESPKARPDPRLDPQGYVQSFQQERPVSQLDRIESMLSTVLAEIQAQSRPPLSACKGCSPVARTVSSPASLPPQPARVGETQTTFPAPRCTGLTGTRREGSES